MNPLRGLALARSIRAAHDALSQRLRDGDALSVDDLDGHGRLLDELIDDLTLHDRQLQESMELLAHRINNLLMAVQTASDTLALEPEKEQLARLRQRLSETVGMGKHTLGEVRQMLGGLR